MDDKKEKNVFADIKVADFSWNIAAPLAVKFMADYGATVIHIESHTHMDTLRVVFPYKDNIPGFNRSGFFTRVESSKMGITLNLNKPKGPELAKRIVQWADVVVENFSPGRMKRWKLDYYSVSQYKPDIVYLSTSLLGQTGPYAQFAGYGGLATAMAGFYYTIGQKTDEPTFAYAAYTDFINPPISTAVILAALDYLRRTGKGTYIDQSQAEGCVHFMAPAVMDYAVNKRVIGRDGNRLPYASPHGVFPCAGDDRWMAIAVFDDAQWKAFCDVPGNPPWTTDDRFSTLRGRKQYEDELDALIAGWTRQFRDQELFDLLQAGNVPCGIVKSNKDLFDDPQLAYRKHFQWLENEELGSHVYERPPFDLSRAEPHIFPAPMLGQHNEHVYSEVLGLTDDEIGDLLVEGVITTDADLPEFRGAL